MSQSKIPSVFIPIVNSDGSEYRFLEVVGKAFTVVKKNTAAELDKYLVELQDYGYYPAGKTAQTAYIQLAAHWRATSHIPTWLTAYPKLCYLHVLSKLSETIAYDSSSSELGLLLAILQQQNRLPYTRIYATGSLLTNDNKLPLVTPIDNLTAKTNAIISHIENHLPTEKQRLLIALPQRIYEQSFDINKNNSEKLVGRRLQAFLQAYPNLTIDVVYFNELKVELTKLYPKGSRYHRLRAWVLTLPFWLMVTLFIWQYQQPLSIQWEAESVYTQVGQSLASTPQRATLNTNGKFMILPPCPTADIGNHVFQQGDILLMTVSVEDNSWFQGRGISQAVMVLVGSQSDIRVEAMQQQPESTQKLGRTVYNLAFTMQPPNEAYAVIAITRRGLAIDKGKLNNRLNQLSQGVDGISRITTVTGYLEKHYTTVDFRFLLESPEKCQL